LRHLAKLEEHQLQAEKDKLEEERSNLELILGSERRLNTLIKKEIQEKYNLSQKQATAIEIVACPINRN